MKNSPLILVSPCLAQKGVEFADASVSLSNRYTDAIIACGGLPQILPCMISRQLIAEIVSRCDGILLTGGDDINPKLYAPDMPPELEKTAGPFEPERDVWEQHLIDELFAQGKPVFGICRGHQMLNVALGGTLLVDIPTQVPDAINHRQMDKRSEPVHKVTIEPDSMLARITGERTLGVNSTHHQAIDKPAESLRVVARSSADGIIEAVELKDPSRLPFLLTVQFHPERLVQGNAVFLKLFGAFIEACARFRGKKL